MTKYKLLFIPNPNIPKDDVPGKWHEFHQLGPYMQGVQTIEIDKDSISLQDIISGIPTPWARTRVFQYAFYYTASSSYGAPQSGLIDYYNYLLQEWKGLIALLALHANRIKISEPIFLDPEISENSSLFEIKSALARMLFDEEELWYMGNKKQAGLQLIYYQDQLIGATSPYTLVFTATTLPNLSNSVPWAKSNHLEDPLKEEVLNEEELKKLYLFVENIKTKIRSFNEAINRFGVQKRISHDSLAAFIEEWLKNIKTALKNKRVEIPASSIPLDSTLNFSSPYYDIFNKKVRPYALGHRLTLTKPANNEGYQEIDPQTLLLQSDYLFKVESTEATPNTKLEESLATILLKVPDSTPSRLVHYFSLPLSETGLLLFQNILSEVTSDSDDTPNHHLKAHYNPKEKTIKVELILFVDNTKFPSITREYKVIDFAVNPNLVLWPNFIAKDWQLYYLYSECPSNDLLIRFKPYFWQNNMQLLESSTSNSLCPKLVIFGDPQTTHETTQVKKLIMYPIEKADSQLQKYEIIKSPLPIAGVAIYYMVSGTEVPCGFLPLKKPFAGTTVNAIRDYNDKHIGSMRGVTVGIDFGSNNTCISYSIDGSDIKPLRLQNRRLFLLGKECPVNKNSDWAKIAYPNELLFFQRCETRNGQLKSWVHTHDERCIVNGMYNAELAGGVPILEPYLQIEDVTEEEVTGRKYMRTNVGRMFYELKWKNDQDGMNLKKGFLKTLWLEICADLFEAGASPKKLIWAYPGALSAPDQRYYRAMYEEIAELQPFKDFKTKVEKPQTESEAVCNYALSRGGFAPTGDDLMIGIDIGGSTSDILIVGNYENKVQLLRQCSARVAANRIIIPFKNSKAIREALQYFVDSPNSPLKLPMSEDIINSPQKIPYYLNLIFDQLSPNQLTDFYRFLAGANAPGLNPSKIRTVFLIPAYLSALILFYASMVARNTLEQYNLPEITRFKVYPFGKGGRIFSWLKGCISEVYASDFYQQIFELGFKCGGKKPDFKFQSFQLESADTPDNKSEVAFGLTARPEVNYSETNLQELVGEEGWIFENQSLAATDVILACHLEKLQAALQPPQTMQNLTYFLDLFFKHVGPDGADLLDHSMVKKLRESTFQLRDKIKNYISYDTEYNSATQKEEFDYRQSLLILEGLCFLDKFLIPNCFSD
ncbi:MAG: hypothetical protein RML72_09730 [Bacteroidia bacterium]|nr:hypothetical protein [Bacteroidia bacterium]MDW8159135.1 hypothetical protein [Bacteroidia bacterium]